MSHGRFSDPHPIASHRRYNIVGTSGSGKSTFAAALSDALNVPHVEMDALFWGPNWHECADDMLAERVANVVEGDAWVLDGNYTRTIPVKWPRVQTVVWLDFSFARTASQAIGRAVRRSWTGDELWPGTGNRETFRGSFFSRDSVLLWTLKQYAINRRKYPTLSGAPEFAHIHFVRLRSRAQATRFLNEAKE
ncbi:MAG: adenylate kinase [Pseudomonadota bacterium]